MTDWSRFFRERSNFPVEFEGPQFGAGVTQVTSVPALMTWRGVWNPFVMGMAKEEVRCAKLPGMDPTFAASLQSMSDNTVQMWNAFSGLSQEQIALTAADILDGMQKTVTRVKADIPTLKTFCPNANIPVLPTQEIVATAERGLAGYGLGISTAAAGAGQIAASGAQGGVQTLEAFVPGSGVDAPGFLGPIISQFKTYAIIGGVVVLGAIVLPELLPMMFAARAASK
jgi:hypothetical protein